MQRIPLIFVFFIPIILSSCLDDPDCVTTTTDFVNVRFFDREENAVRDTLRLTQLEARGADSILIDVDTLVTYLRLPLDPQQPEVTYVFNSQYGTDSLVLSYRLGTRLISEDCGVEIIYSGIDYVIHSFDSVSVVNQVPVEEIDEDIKVFN